MLNKLKQFRRIATRYDKTRKSFLAFLNLAAVKLWLPSFVNKTWENELMKNTFNSKRKHIKKTYSPKKTGQLNIANFPSIVIKSATEFLHKNAFEDAFTITGNALDNLDIKATCTQILEIKALRGIAAYNIKQYEIALPLLEEVCKNKSINPMIMSGLALTYRMLHRGEEALNAIMYCINNDQKNYQHYLHGALIATDLGKYEVAMSLLLRAQGLDYKNPSIHLAMAQHLLALGEYKPGWREYEWRDFIPNPGNELPEMTSAPWNGMRIPGGYLLVVCDQGFGDCLQFVRFLPLARERCAKIILACSRELFPLFNGLPGADEYCTEWTSIPPHAAHCRISSLPCLLNIDDESQFSTGDSYITASPERQAVWKERLAETRPKTIFPNTPSIGLIWQGRRTHANDMRRSIPFHILRPLADIQNCRFVCLQKPIPEGAIKEMEQFAGFCDWSDQLTDYAETAALVSNLDLVISIDSSVAHLSGALGIPTWVLLPQPAEWRWGTHGTKTPWYPKTKLFRQRTAGSWEPVIQDIVKNIRDILWLI